MSKKCYCIGRLSHWGKGWRTGRSMMTSLKRIGWAKPIILRWYFEDSCSCISGPAVTTNRVCLFLNEAFCFHRQKPEMWNYSSIQEEVYYWLVRVLWYIYLVVMATLTFCWVEWQLYYSRCVAWLLIQKINSYTVVLQLVVKLKACRSMALRVTKSQLPEILDGCPIFH